MENIKEFLENKYTKEGICAYCNTPFGNRCGNKFQGKKFIFPKSLIKNITNERNYIPLHYECVKYVIEEILKYNGNYKEDTPIYIIRD